MLFVYLHTFSLLLCNLFPSDRRSCLIVPAVVTLFSYFFYWVSHCIELSLPDPAAKLISSWRANKESEDRSLTKRILCTCDHASDLYNRNLALIFVEIAAILDHSKAEHTSALHNLHHLNICTHLNLS